MATRAQAALVANDLPPRSASAKPRSSIAPATPGFRALLGNIYLAAGRYASAEALVPAMR